MCHIIKYKKNVNVFSLVKAIFQESENTNFILTPYLLYLITYIHLHLEFAEINKRLSEGKSNLITTHSHNCIVYQRQ